MNQNYCITVLGPALAGKTTHGRRFAETHGLPVIDTGELIRRKAQFDKSFSKAVLPLIKRGQLIPDGFIMRLFANKIVSLTGQHFVLVGMPRTAWQAKRLRQFLANKTGHTLVLVYLDVDETEALRRLRENGQGRLRRDDSPAIICERHELFRKTTRRVIFQLRDAVLVPTIYINGNSRLKDDVYLELEGKLGPFVKEKG